MRFRLLHCDRCARRTWVIDDQLPVHGDRLHAHDWVELYTFCARDNGPGLAPDPEPCHAG